MDTGKMEILGIDLNEFKMVKVLLEVKMKIPLCKNCAK